MDANNESDANTYNLAFLKAWKNEYCAGLVAKGVCPDDRNCQNFFQLEISNEQAGVQQTCLAIRFPRTSACVKRLAIRNAVHCFVSQP